MKFLRSPKFLIFLVVFINFLGYGIVFPLLPILTLDYGGDPLISGVMIGIFSLMQVVSMPVLGRLSDRWGRRPMLLFSLVGSAFWQNKSVGAIYRSNNSYSDKRFFDPVFSEGIVDKKGINLREKALSFCRFSERIGKVGFEGTLFY